MLNYSSIQINCGVTGFPSPAAEYKQMQLSIDDLLINHPNATFLAKACGNSMRECGIFNGDILIIDRSLVAKTNDIVICNLNGEFVCKILNIETKTLFSANTTIAPIPIKELDEFSIEGIVTASIRSHQYNIKIEQNVCPS